MSNRVDGDLALLTDPVKSRDGLFLDGRVPTRASRWKKGIWETSIVEQRTSIRYRQMSCNPAIGGIGKSHLVKEIDALGGAMAVATDQAGIQFRVLNGRKGPAVRATRAQADRVLYRNAIRRIVESAPNLRAFQQTVVDLVINDGVIAGVVT